MNVRVGAQFMPDFRLWTLRHFARVFVSRLWCHGCGVVVVAVVVKKVPRIYSTASSSYELYASREVGGNIQSILRWRFGNQRKKKVEAIQKWEEQTSVTSQRRNQVLVSVFVCVCVRE